MALLSVQDLTQHFPIAGSKKAVRAVNGVSFEVEEGETLALVGESGSGKTTIGRCVLGLIKPTAGVIVFDGKEMGRGRTVRSKGVRGTMQLVFQEPAEGLNPRLKIHEIIAEPLRALGINRADRERRVRDAARTVGLPAAALTLMSPELSMGLQQRVGIARAIASEPRLVVLDEPTSALDPTARAEIIDLIARIQRDRGTAFVFISHDLSAVRHIAQRVAVLYLGMIVEEGPSATLFAQPSHPYSAGLLSSVLLPNPRLKRRSTIELEGEIPSPIDLPPACFLAGRCPLVEPRCEAEMPPVDRVGPHHLVRCFRHEEVAEMEEAVDYFARFQAEAERILSAEVPADAAPTASLNTA